MAAIVNTALAGFTVDYNGIQFGGSDATYKSYPPNYHFTADEVWDDSRRAVVSIKCRLLISCVFLEDSYTQMSANMRAIRTALQQPGRVLKLSGLGSGFDWINPALQARDGDMKDIGGGPRPLPLQMNPIGGQLAWELIWGIEFEVSNCYSGSGFGGFDSLAFTSFNFSTTWRNDFEGYSSRVIQGKVSIPFVRSAASPKTVLHIAEETRGNIFISVPVGFKRAESVWHESVDKHSLEFTIVDEQLQGDPYPAGITQADGSFSINTGSSEGNTFCKVLATLQASFKTAYNQPKNLAGQVFIGMMLAKQAEIQTAMNGLHTANPTTVPLGQILPLHFAIQNGKFDSARLTQASVSWILIQDFNSILSASNIFAPVGGQDYTTWRTSMSALYGNRGTSVYGSLASEAVIIDLCDNVQSKTIGVTSDSSNNPANVTFDPITCPSVPDNGGWIHFDLEIQVLRQERSSRHVKAASYVPVLGTIDYPYDQQPNTGNGVLIKIGGPGYSQSASDQTVTEYHGYPVFLIGLKFSGVRFKHTPQIPRIQSVGGMIVREYGDQLLPSPKHVMDSFGCPVWSVSGYRVYSVPGYVEKIKPVSSLVAADTTIPLEL